MHKYSLIHLYHIACMYVFSADPSVVDNHLVCSSQEETIPPVLSIPSLLVVLCVWLRPHGLSPIDFVTSTIVLIQSVFKLLGW